MKKILFVFFTFIAFASFGQNEIPTGGYAYFTDSAVVTDGWVGNVEMTVTGNDLVTVEHTSTWVVNLDDARYAKFSFKVMLDRAAEIGATITADFNIAFTVGEVAQNLDITGFEILVTEPVPVAYIGSYSTYAPVGYLTKFYNQSGGDLATTVEWVFEGGTPATSNDHNPAVSYATAGVYDVTLTVTNDYGTDTWTMTDYVTVGQLTGAECQDVFISEYIEGTNNNKSLELYNPTSAAIDLSAYQLARYSNGGTTPVYVGFTAGTMIDSEDVLVVSLDKQNCSLGGQDTCLFEELRNQTDIYLCPVYDENNMMYFNGNDALTLEKTSGAVVDIFGKVGENPGIAWTDVAADGFVGNDSYSANNWSKDHTLVRKAGIMSGISANPTIFNATIEWVRYPENTFDQLQKHDCMCHDEIVGIDAPVVLTKKQTFIYPNPVTDSHFVVKSTGFVVSVELLNMIGQTVYKQNNKTDRADINVQIPTMDSGLYLVKVEYNDNTSTVKKLYIK